MRRNCKFTPCLCTLENRELPSHPRPRLRRPPVVVRHVAPPRVVVRPRVVPVVHTNPPTPQPQPQPQPPPAPRPDVPAPVGLAPVAFAALGLTPIPTAPAMSTGFTGAGHALTGVVQSQVFRGPNGLYAYAYKVTNNGPGAALPGLSWHFGGPVVAAYAAGGNAGNLGAGGAAPTEAFLAGGALTLSWPGGLARGQTSPVIVVLSPAAPQQQLVNPAGFALDPVADLPVAYAP